MSLPSIAIIGQTERLRDGSLTRGGALAQEIRRFAPTARVTFRAVVPTATEVDAITTTLVEAGITAQITSRAESDVPGPIRKGDRLDIWGIFAHDIVVLDVDDVPLREFLTDLPAHTKPDVRLLGPLPDAPLPEHAIARDVALRFDTLVGTDLAYRALTDADDAFTDIAARMIGANLRTAIRVAPDTLTIAMRDEPIREIPRAAESPATTLARVALAMATRADWATLVLTATPIP